MFARKTLNTSLRDIFISHPYEIDEGLSVFVRKSSAGKSGGRNKKIDPSELKKERGFIWINNPQYHFTVEDLEKNETLSSREVPVFISGCNGEVISFFKRHNYETLKVGKEAVLFLTRNHFEKSSLRELVRRGFKHGLVEEIPYSLETAKKLEDFKKLCVHGHEPQLKYFFNDKFRPDTRLFVYKNKNAEWQGAITVACVTPRKVRTDLILRNKNARNGVMEALMFFIFNILKEEGYHTWSLGEVPYIVDKSPFFSKEFFINFTGRRFKFAYNYLGLYNFKNKFEPVWGSMYICSRPKLSILTLIEISWISNLIKLVLQKAATRAASVFAIKGE